MPMVDGITAQVLSGGGVFRGSDRLYYIGSDNPNYEQLRPAAEPAIGLARAVEPRVVSYYGRAATYEELASLLSQLADTISFEYENPLPPRCKAPGSRIPGREDCTAALRRLMGRCRALEKRQGQLSVQRFLATDFASAITSALCFRRRPLERQSAVTPR